MPDVTQTSSGRDGDFTVADLREFVTSANTFGLPDTTTVVCTANGSPRDNLSSLATRSPLSGTDEDTAITALSERGAANAPGAVERTHIDQPATGRVVEWKHWLRPTSARTLTLGDVRALLNRVAELGVPEDIYVMRALFVGRGNKYLVYRISAQAGTVAVAVAGGAE